MPPRPQFGLDDIVGGARRLVEGNRRTFKGQGPYPEGSSINTAIQQGAVNPLKTLGEFSGVADAYRGFTPGASIGRQALGLASILTPLSAQEEAIVGAQKLAALMARAPKEAIDDSYLFGKTVVHGSPVSGLSEISPTKAAFRPQESLSYGWDPSAFGKDPERIYMAVDEYTQPKTSSFFDPDNMGSVYVGRVPRSSIVSPPESGMVVSNAPIKRLSEIKMKLGEPSEYGYRFKEGYTDALRSALRRKGVVQGVDVAGKAAKYKDRLISRIRPDVYNGPV